jgi:S-adenosylmethionine hydrolase
MNIVYKTIKYFLGIYVLIFFIFSNVFAQVEEQNLGETKTSTEGTYNFYNTKTKEKTGYSQKRKKDIIYYDRHGKIIGTLKQDRKKKEGYNFYNADGVRIGSLRKRPTGSYMYLDTTSGKIVEAAPLNRKDVSSISPEIFVSHESK